MERLLSWIRDNPQAAAVGLGFAITTLVISVLAFMMHRAGTSLRPIIWFAGFMAVVGGPQAVVHLLDNYAAHRVRSVRTTSPELLAEIEKASQPEPEAPAGPLSPVPWSEVFGPKADPSLIVDAKLGLQAILHDALEAKISFNANGESALAARFPSAESAGAALNRYGSFFSFQKASGDDQEGWTAWRSIGDWAHVVVAGNELYAWTSSSLPTVTENRERVLGPLAISVLRDQSVKNREVHARALEAAGYSSAAMGPRSVSRRLSANVPAMTAFLVLNLAAAAFWFFKGSAWAARVEGPPVALPAAAETLRHDLLAVNRQDVPTEVTQRADGTIEINWRYADARWFDLMRVHRMKRAHRLVLSLDESSRTVRVTEYMSAFDASAGLDKLQLSWKAARGIQFFETSHQRVFGVQLDDDGKPTGELSKAYTFNLQTLKAPIITAVTESGWRWQPVTWDAPSWLRWLTE